MASSFTRFTLTVACGAAVAVACGYSAASPETCGTSSPKDARYGRHLLQYKEYHGSHGGTANSAIVDLMNRMDQMEDQIEDQMERYEETKEEHPEARMATVEARVATMEGGLRSTEDKLRQLVSAAQAQQQALLSAQASQTSQGTVNTEELMPIIEALVKEVSALRVGAVEVNKQAMNRVILDEARIDGLEDRLDIILGNFGDKVDTQPKISSSPQNVFLQTPVYTMQKGLQGATYVVPPQEVGADGSGFAPDSTAGSMWGPQELTVEQLQSFTPEQLRALGIRGAPPSVPIA